MKRVAIHSESPCSTYDRVISEIEGPFITATGLKTARRDRLGSDVSRKVCLINLDLGSLLDKSSINRVGRRPRARPGHREFRRGIDGMEGGETIAGKVGDIWIDRGSKSHLLGEGSQGPSTQGDCVGGITGNGGVQRGLRGKGSFQVPFPLFIGERNVSPESTSGDRGRAGIAFARGPYCNISKPCFRGRGRRIISGLSIEGALLQFPVGD